MVNTMMQKKADSKLKHLKKNIKIEFSIKCTKDTKNNLMILYTAIKMHKPPSINTGMTQRTKSIAISNNIKPRWTKDTIKKSIKPNKNLKYNSALKSRKPQNYSISEKWKSTWSNKNCTF